MTTDEAIKLMRAFTNQMEEMNVAQAWAAVTFAIETAAKMTQPEHMPMVIEQLNEMLKLQCEERTVH